MFNKYLIIGAISVGLVACGGGGGSSGGQAGNENHTINTKVFPRTETDKSAIFTKQKFTVDNLLVSPDQLSSDINNIGANQIYITDLSLNMNGKNYSKGAVLDLADFGSGLNTIFADFANIGIKYSSGKEEKLNSKRTVLVYKQDNSGVVLVKPSSVDYAEVKALWGNPTAKENIPVAGSLTYKGDAFGYHRGELQKGELMYVIDFDRNQGAGAIKSNGINIVLNPASLSELKSTNTGDSMIGISGSATQVDSKGEAMALSGKGGYELGVFGPNGKEIVGHTHGFTEPLYGGITITDPITGESTTTEKYIPQWQIGFAGTAR